MKKLLFVMSLAAGSLGVAVAASSCTTSAQMQAGYVAPQPTLVWAEPGVWVVADSAYPIFYNDGYYWLYSDGYWYSSTYYWGGWVYAPPPRVPIFFNRIRNPRLYANYRWRRNMRSQPAPVPPQYRTRDHRGRQFQPPPRRDNRQPMRQPVRRNEKVPARRGAPR